ncbi:hypothetical protein E4U16_006735 [Claviceps sp. LM84 group G4]|nr:hypothetical protein E4U16_006735 [Claviceps sp. LM84 group G4]
MESEGDNVNHQSQEYQPVERWTEDEDALLIQLRSYNLSWSNIADSFTNPRRTMSSCRYRYSVIKDRVQTMQESESKTAFARLYESHKEEMWTKVAERMSTKPSWRVAEHNHWCIGQLEMARRAGEEFLINDPVDLPQLEANNYQRYNNAQVQIQQHPQQVTEIPTWSGDEEAILLAKYRAEMQWKDISTYLPGRLKQRMWEQIGETMSVEWQVAERIHWGLGKDGIAELAGVPLTLQPAADLTLTPQERGPTTKEWLNLVCQ